MGFVAAIQSGFRKYFKFSGRASRSEFWYWVLFMVSTGILLKMLDKSIFDAPVMGITLYPVSDSFGWLTLFPFLALTWRRVHDTGRSGWWVGLGFLWFIFTVIFAIIMAIFIPWAIKAGIVVNEGNAEAFKAFFKAAPFVMTGVNIIWVIILFVFCCIDTKEGDNKYGEDPKYSQGAVIFD